MAQPFGLIHWKAAASRKLIGRARAARSAGPAWATRQARRSRKAAQASFSARPSAGTAASSSVTPRPTPASITVKPIPTPSMCGSVRRRPKLAPEAISISVFGPGVIEVAKAKAASAGMSVMSMRGGLCGFGRHRIAFCGAVGAICARNERTGRYRPQDLARADARRTTQQRRAGGAGGTFALGLPPAGAGAGGFGRDPGLSGGAGPGGDGGGAGRLHDRRAGRARQARARAVRAGDRGLSRGGGVPQRHRRGGVSAAGRGGGSRGLQALPYGRAGGVAGGALVDELRRAGLAQGRARLTAGLTGGADG